MADRFDWYKKEIPAQKVSRYFSINILIIFFKKNKNGKFFDSVGLSFNFRVSSVASTTRKKFLHSRNGRCLSLSYHRFPFVQYQIDQIFEPINDYPP
jgi:hypothetical protein